MTSTTSAAPRDALVVSLVALGGALGALVRWRLDVAYPVAPGTFPTTTLAVNVVGSFLLALLPALPAVRRSAYLPAALGPGVLGGFTTLSATSEQTRALLARGDVLLATSYAVGGLLACVLAVALAAHLTQRSPRSGRRGDR